MELLNGIEQPAEIVPSVPTVRAEEIKVEAEPLGTAEQPAEVVATQKPNYLQLGLKLSGKSSTRRKKLLRLANFYKNKSVDKDPSLTKQIKRIEPPEQWTISRLRQNGRELVRKRISAFVGNEHEKMLRKQAETSGERKRRLQRNRSRKVHRTEAEEEKQKRKRVKKAVRISNESKEQRCVRLRLERQERAGRRQKMRLESLADASTQQWLSQQREFVNFKVEMIDEDQKADMGDFFEIGDPFPEVLIHRREEENSTGTITVEIGNLFPEVLLPEEFSTETSTESSKTQKSEFDVVSNLLHSKCRKHQQDKRLQRFDNRCTSRSSNYILSTVVWHKLNGRTGKATV